MRKAVIYSMLAVMAAGAGAVVFTVEQRVKERNRDLARLHRNIAENSQQLHMLRAEWEYLNNPERVRELTERYLDLEPPAALQVSDNFFAPDSGFMLSRGREAIGDRGSVEESGSRYSAAGY